MALTREIEKLQRRWQENPLGLTFAPLAEAYRKEGMAADALELLAIGLAQHPQYVPAHIVRGRCFLDGRDDHSAERAFLRVTELDPENVIALKALADIGERAGRFDEATGRLERLLDIDRANDEAREQLDRLRAMLATPGLDRDAPPAPAEAAAPVSPVADPAPAAPVVEVPVEEAVVASVAPAPEPAEPPSDTVVVPEIVPESVAVPEAPSAPEPIAAAVRDDVEVILYHPVELSAAESNEFQRGGDAERLRPSEARGGLPEVESLPEPAVPEPPPVVEVDSAADPEDAPSIEAEDALAVAGMESEPELIVTETMAELFLRQGHKELALAVYAQLAARDPDQPRIRAAMEQLQGEVRREVPALPVYAAVLTGGQSVRAFFEQLLAATRPAPAGAAVDPGLSLGAVFGEDAGPARSAGPAEAGPSFDEFYGGDPVAEAAAATAPADVDEAVAADLESFTSWLKGLKR